MIPVIKRKIDALTREQMVSRRGSSGYLPVQELAAALQLLYQVGQKRADFFLSIRKLNAEHGCAVEHTVQMILQRIDLIIKYHCRLINAVSKIKSAVIKSNDIGW